MHDLVLVNEAIMQQGSLILAEDLERMGEVAQQPPPDDRWAGCGGLLRELSTGREFPKHMPRAPGRPDGWEVQSECT